MDKWLSKPDQVNEVEWAKRGWRCVERETVGCVGGCEARLVVNLQDDDEEQPGDGEEGGEDAEENEEKEDLREETGKELVKRYRALLAEGHEEGCLWRRRGCDGMNPPFKLKI